MDDSQPTQKEIPTQLLNSKELVKEPKMDLVISNKLNVDSGKSSREFLSRFDNDQPATIVAKLSHTENNRWDIILSNRLLESKKHSYIIGVNEKAIITCSPAEILHYYCKIYTILNEKLAKTSCKFLYMLESLDESNVLVNGRSVNKGTAKYIFHGDRIELGPDIFHISIYSQKDLIVEAETHQFTQAIKDEYMFLQKVGAGNFATVWLSLLKSQGKEFACKIINKKKQLLKSGMSHVFEREVSLMKRLSHPNIVKCWDVLTDSHRIYIFMEFMAGGDLLTYILEHGALTEPESKNWFSRIADAVRYLHGNNITHRDIKLENVLINLNSDNKITDIKLADFGLARAVGENEMMKTMCGTPSYLAPEIFCNPREAQYTKSVDIWALGVVLYAMNTGEFPFVRMPLGGKITTETFIRSSQLIMSNRLFAALTPQLRNLIQKALTVEPLKRAKIDEILMDKWIYSSRYSTAGTKDLLFDQKEAWGTIVSTPDSEWQIDIDMFNDKVLVGRGSNNDIIIKYDRLSRNSFILDRSAVKDESSSESGDSKQCIFITRNSKAPIWLNGTELPINIPTRIYDGDVIKLVKKSPHNNRPFSLFLNLSSNKRKVWILENNNLAQTLSDTGKRAKDGSQPSDNETSAQGSTSRTKTASVEINPSFSWIQLQPKAVSCLKNTLTQKNISNCSTVQQNQSSSCPWSQLTLIKKGLLLKRWILTETGYTMGRGKDNDIIINDDRINCSVFKGIGGDFGYVVDRSTNGTWVNNIKIKPDSKCIFSSGDVLIFDFTNDQTFTEADRKLNTNVDTFIRRFVELGLLIEQAQ